MWLSFILVRHLPKIFQVNCILYEWVCHLDFLPWTLTLGPQHCLRTAIKVALLDERLTYHSVLKKPQAQWLGPVKMFEQARKKAIRLSTEQQSLLPQNLPQLSSATSIHISLHNLQNGFAVLQDNKWKIYLSPSLCKFVEGQHWPELAFYLMVCTSVHLAQHSLSTAISQMLLSVPKQCRVASAPSLPVCLCIPLYLEVHWFCSLQLIQLSIANNFTT